MFSRLSEVKKILIKQDTSTLTTLNQITLILQNTFYNLYIMFLKDIKTLFTHSR